MTALLNPKTLLLSNLSLSVPLKCFFLRYHSVSPSLAGTIRLGNVSLSFRTEHLSIGTLLNDYLLSLFQGPVAREILKVTFLLLVLFFLNAKVFYFGIMNLKIITFCLLQSILNKSANVVDDDGDRADVSHSRDLTQMGPE